jgi:dienelactone hydrolase
MKRWPLLIFLHGSGEAGYDLNKVKVHGPPKLSDKGKKFPFIIVSPQAWPQAGWDADHLYRFLQHIKQTQRIDNSKVYMTGLSMGGYGTWEFAMKYPGELAAIAPVCGGGDSTTAWRFRYVPVWNFHGAKDDVVLPAQSEKMVIAARQYNPEVRYTLYPHANHNSWDLTYDNDSLYLWMLSKSKFSFVESKLAVEKLTQYTGRYAGADDTVKVTIRDNHLLAIPGRDTITLKYAGNNSFFIDPNEPVELRFQQNNNRVTGFLFLGGHRELYRKVK